MLKELKKIRIINFLLLTVAGMINAFGITIFLAPVKLYDSGISGTSMLLDQITPEYLTLSIFLLVLNIPLFVYGLKKTGNKIYSICNIYGNNLLCISLAHNRRVAC